MEILGREGRIGAAAKAGAAAAGAAAVGHLVKDRIGIDLDPRLVAAGDQALELGLVAADGGEILIVDRLVGNPPTIPRHMLGGGADLHPVIPLGPQHVFALVGDIVIFPAKHMNHHASVGALAAQRHGDHHGQ